jgi:hypothetical protein
MPFSQSKFSIGHFSVIFFGVNFRCWSAKMSEQSPSSSRFLSGDDADDYSTRNAHAASTYYSCALILIVILTMVLVKSAQQSKIWKQFNLPTLPYTLQIFIVGFVLTGITDDMKMGDHEKYDCHQGHGGDYYIVGWCAITAAKRLGKKKQKHKKHK